MTTPNLPWATTSVEDLPQGVVAPGQLGEALQDHTKEKYTGKAASRFPTIASTTLAGSPSGSGPIGIVTGFFSQITSNVATADPATITKPDDIVDKAGSFFTGLPVLKLIPELIKAIQGLATAAPLALMSDLFSLRWAQVDNAATSAQLAKDQAQGALDAATAADRKVTALLQGGVRTVYTSNFTWTKPSDLVKLGVLVYGGGRTGTNAAWGAPGGAGGGVIYAEFPADVLPSSVPGTIGAGSSGPAVSSPSTFGSLVSSSDSGGGQLSNSTLLALASSIFPGDGGASGALISGGAGNITPGQPGGSTALAAGGTGGSGSGGAAHGGPGGNAAVSGQYLAGGGGGGGGLGYQGNGNTHGNGGAGGFPGGGGGGAGRTSNETYRVGGIGAMGLIALIEFKAAA